MPADTNAIQFDVLICCFGDKEFPVFFHGDLKENSAEIFFGPKVLFSLKITWKSCCHWQW